ncbi:MAG: hypothetical protein AAGF12_31640 [Myxococcota bacterium]
MSRLQAFLLERVSPPSFRVPTFLCHRGKDRVLMAFFASLGALFFALALVLLASFPLPVALTLCAVVMVSMIGYVDLGAPGFPYFAEMLERQVVRRRGVRVVGQVRVLQSVEDGPELAATVRPRSDDEKCFYAYLGPGRLPLIGLDVPSESSIGEFLVEGEDRSVRISGQELLLSGGGELCLRDGDQVNLVVIAESNAPVPAGYRASSRVLCARPGEQVLVESVQPLWERRRRA